VDEIDQCEANYIRVVPLHAQTFYENCKQRNVHGRGYSANDEISNYAVVIRSDSYGLISLTVACRSSRALARCASPSYARAAE
jgi:hypothetical protein